MNLKSLLIMMISEIKGVLLAPRSYFALMPKTGGYREPIFKALMYGIFFAIYFMALTFFNFSGLQMILAILAYFILIPLFYLASLFIGSAFFFIVSSICGGDTSFESSTRLTASLYALSIPFALILIFPAISQNLYYSALILFIGYTMLVLYKGLVYSLNTRKTITKIIVILIFLFKLASLIGLYIIAKKMSKIRDAGFDDMQMEHELQESFIEHGNV